ncbi:OsmC family protein [Desulfospira joergensenii]|uniref:OsmC family protein n=1 Tax=Desulfospira joergensenii TaxID=53329 RepID=UPI0003B6F18C|nr:OsmC family protein [Desulfospira joergensenii]
MEPFEIIFPENKKIDIKFKNFLIQTDQSKQNGGDETAPEPFALFLASLGSCAGIYAKVFCDSRKIDTSDMKLILEVFFKEKQKLLHRIEITLHVGQDFPEKYIKPVIKAMAGCAVKNQLHPDIETETRVVYA